jgi:hypothetical protein
MKIYGKKKMDGLVNLVAVYEFTAYSREKQNIAVLFFSLSIP